ncbi:TonB-dependent receptor domain-containing protein [Massilia sp. IC2-476]|uniref:TonB-dependent receptor domain-containing protein n=1 Tax=Massilia sp. IC2-476 TaxID=2887199 RepID=UPI001D12408B|nr:TonB-dependent receptor [Massilia sp. IC2-476]MCC2971723.1 TonB-dependent receptor [Massilia sp. IC2-476]
MAFAASAYAQDAQQAPAEGQQLQRVEVTGSRIATANLESVSPVTVVGAKDIKLEGTRSVENLLNNLPQVFADQGGSISNGSSGTATVNLRNFGADRTLVLVNGRRLPAGSPRNTAADLNQIPAALIKRVEVLTGGASAIYGSDAVAGVVNFIMNDNFQGVQIESNYAFYNHEQKDGAAAQAAKRRNFPVPDDKSADGKVKDVNLLLGGNFADGRGNAVAFIGYKKEDPLLQSERDFTACSLDGFSSGNTFNCGGSGTSFPGRFILANGNSYTVANNAGGVRPYVAATDQYNYGPLNYFRRPSERYTFSSFTHYDINDNARLYTEASFHDDHTVAQIAPSGLFGFDASGPNAIRYENPFLSQAWRTQLGLTGPGSTADALIFRRNVEGGGRQDDQRHTSYRGVIGIKGDIGNWTYDAFAQVGKVLYSETYFNDFSNVRIGRALNVVTGANGQPVCQSVVDGTDPNCVPYNIWSLGQITPEALNYLQTPGFQKGSTHQSVQGINLSTDLGEYGIKLPTASRGVGLALGWEHRTEKLSLDTDTAFQTGDLAGQGGPTLGVAGQFSVRDYYAEARIPVLEKAPFADSLTLNGSFRRSDYSTGQKTDSYGVGAEWSPVQAAKVRFSYQRAARAANVVELFTPSGLSLFGMSSDPCAGATPSASFAQCARTGVTQAQYGRIEDSPAGQYNQITGGNTNLAPEESDSYTLGLVLTPMRNLSLTIDAFDMKVEGVIGGLPASTTLTQCLQTGDPKFCSLIQRDRLGSLWALNAGRIVATNQNLGMRSTKGLDLGANYGMKLAGYGSLDLSYIGTVLKEFKSEDFPGSGEYDCAGLHGTTCGTPLPKYRHKIRAVWGTPWRGLEVGVTWRYIKGVKLDATSDNELLATDFEPADEKLAARNYLDLVGQWAINKNFTLRAGMNNALDKDPPVTGVVAAVFGNGNTYPQVYDAMGRHIFLNLTAKF